jgi:hypothetical protein
VEIGVPVSTRESALSTQASEQCIIHVADSEDEYESDTEVCDTSSARRLAGCAQASDQYIIHVTDSDDGYESNIDVGAPPFARQSTFRTRKMKRYIVGIEYFIMIRSFQSEARLLACSIDVLLNYIVSCTTGENIDCWQPLC